MEILKRDESEKKRKKENLLFKSTTNTIYKLNFC